jgi:prophage DNA circulation protein
MGWKDELHDASFRGVAFECTSVSSAQAKTVAIHQAPYSNEASAEDMGNDARRITVNAMYTGDDYLTWRDALEAALLQTGPGELIHPTEGVKQVQVLDYSVNEDAENPDYCTFNIVFLVTKTEKRQLFIPVQVAREITPLAILEAPAAEFTRSMEKLKANYPEKYFNLVKTVRDGLQSVRSGLNLAKKTIQNILGPETWVTGLVDDISGLVNFDYSISAVSQWRDVLKRVERFADVFNQPDHPKELKQLWRATQVAAVVGVTQEVIKTVRQEMLEQQNLPNQDQKAEPVMASMTPIDLAKVRSKTRETIVAAIQAEREYGSSDMAAVSFIQNYKYIADQVHLQIQELIEIRPPIMTMVVPVPCTFHWLAHHLYGDMTRAAEIRRLNQDIANPALLLKGMEVTVYAR